MNAEEFIVSADVAPPAGSSAAALAFSMLSARCADEVMRRLSPVERARLVAALERTQNARSAERAAALQQLVADLAETIAWPEPVPAHEVARRMFQALQQSPDDQLMDALQRLSKREPLAAAVTLSSFDADVREKLWETLDPEVRAGILAQLPDASSVTRAARERIARDLRLRLARNI
jgi:flagellar motor switch protein FliG